MTLWQLPCQLAANTWMVGLNLSQAGCELWVLNHNIQHWQHYRICNKNANVLSWNYEWFSVASDFLLHFLLPVQVNLPHNVFPGINVNISDWWKQRTPLGTKGHEIGAIYSLNCSWIKSKSSSFKPQASSIAGGTNQFKMICCRRERKKK